MSFKTKQAAPVNLLATPFLFIWPDDQYGCAWHFS